MVANHQSFLWLSLTFCFEFMSGNMTLEIELVCTCVYSSYILMPSKVSNIFMSTVRKKISVIDSHR